MLSRPRKITGRRIFRPAPISRQADMNNLVRLRLSEGERVQVTRRGQNPAAANVTVNIQTPNPAAFQASRVQVAGQISRAVAYGQRGM